MDQPNDKTRIEQLEQALQQCIDYLRALPPHPQTYRAAAAAQEVLGADVVSQPTFAKLSMSHCKDDPLVLSAMLTPGATQVILHSHGDIDKNLRQLKFNLEMSMTFDFVPDSERATRYFESVELAKNEHAVKYGYRRDRFERTRIG